MSDWPRFLEPWLVALRRCQTALVIAVVAAQPITFGVARQFQALSPSRSLDVRIFKERDTALAWLREAAK